MPRSMLSLGKAISDLDSASKKVKEDLDELNAGPLIRR
jgi:hypothetical protein